MPLGLHPPNDTLLGRIGYEAAVLEAIAVWRRATTPEAGVLASPVRSPDTAALAGGFESKDSQDIIFGHITWKFCRHRPCPITDISHQKPFLLATGGRTPP